jgi:hypothetical protein
LTNIGASNGLLRQYFPKGTDLSVHSPQRLLEVAHELNARPRRTLGIITPADAMQRLILNRRKAGLPILPRGCPARRDRRSLIESASLT